MAARAAVPAWWGRGTTGSCLIEGAVTASPWHIPGLRAHARLHLSTLNNLRAVGRGGVTHLEHGNNRRSG